MNCEALIPPKIGYSAVSKNRGPRRSADTNLLVAALSRLRTRAYLKGRQGEGVEDA